MMQDKARSSSSPSLGPRLSGLRAVSAALQVAASEGYDRLTVPQLLFFCAVAEADMMGQDVTFTEIRENLGSAISKSLHSTYRTLMEPRGKTTPNAVGWMRADENPVDLREKFLRLTPKGHAVALAISMALVNTAQ